MNTSAPFGAATAPHSRPNPQATPFVATASLRELLRDYRARRAQVEARQTDDQVPPMMKQVLRLQAQTWTLVIDDLATLIEGTPGRFDG